MNFKTMLKAILGKPDRKSPDAYNADHRDTFELMRGLKYDMEMADSVKLGGDAGGIVYSYPVEEDPDLVVRISKSDASGSDGWVQYAETLRQNWTPGTPHYGPMLLDVAHDNGVWMSVTPKLSPIDMDNPQHAALISAARKIIDPHRWGEATVAESAFIEKNQPGFTAFAREHLQNASDLDHSNFMLDGDRLIVNDPIGTMDPQFEAEMRTKYDLSVPRSHIEPPAYLFD